MDPEFRKISEKFRNDHEAFKDAFARAWFKLTHRDMGPKVRYLGPEVPAEDLIWQDPVPAGTKPSDGDVAAFKSKILGAGLASASWSRPPGRRHRPIAGPTTAAAPMARASGLLRRRTGRSTSPAELARMLAKIDELRGGAVDGRCDRSRRHCGSREGGEGRRLQCRVPFTGGRGDATQDWTDAESFAVMEPAADGSAITSRPSIR